MLAKLLNYEQQGVPAGSGTACNISGFDLGRMHRLLKALGDPHRHWPVVHVAGSKGRRCRMSRVVSQLLKGTVQR